MSSEVNVLTNSPKICDVTNKDVFQLNFYEKNESIGWSILGEILAEFGIH